MARSYKTNTHQPWFNAAEDHIAGMARSYKYD